MRRRGPSLEPRAPLRRPRPAWPLKRLAVGLTLSLSVHALALWRVERWLDEQPETFAPPAEPPPAQGSSDRCAAREYALGHRPAERFGPDPLRHRIDLISPLPAEPPAEPWPVVVLLPDDRPSPPARPAPATQDPTAPPAASAPPEPENFAPTPPLALELARHGYVVAILHEPVAPQGADAAASPLRPAELQMALHWLHTERARLHIDPQRTALIGGYLAARAQLTSPAHWLDRAAPRPPLRALVLPTLPIEGVAAEAPEASCAEPAVCTDCAALPALSPALSSAAPPTLLLSGTQDCTWPAAHAETLVAQLKTRGVEAQHRRFSGQLGPAQLLSDRRARRSIEGFLAEQLLDCTVQEMTAAVLSEEEVDRLIALALPPPVPEAEKPKPEEEPEKKAEERLQIVQIPPPENPQVPDEARFQSEYDSKTDREMVSALNDLPTPQTVRAEQERVGHGAVPEGQHKQKSEQPVEPKAPPKPVQRPDPQRGDSASSGDAPPSEQPQSPQPKKPQATPTPTPVKKVPTTAPTLGEGPFRAAQSEVPEHSAPSGGGQQGSPAPPASYRDLLPSYSKFDQVFKDGSIDYIEDVERGDRTMLNTKEYKHAWFFNRVKAQVQQRWRAVDAHRRNDPHGRIYGVRDRLTVVQVVLKPDGYLEEIYIVKDSGVSFLDDAAIQAFQDAQPFANPPPDLQDKDGRIRFRFSFYLEISSRGLRLFRAP